MGLFSDYFGGQAKVRNLPSQMRDIAGRNYDMSGALHDYFNRVGANADQYTPQIRQQMRTARDALSPAIGFAEKRAEQSRGLWDSSFYPTINQTVGEIARAGSTPRQQQKAAQARDEYMANAQAGLMQLGRESGRLGFGGSRSPYNAQTALTMAGGAANSANTARERERMYGEMVRQNNLGGFLQQGDAALQHSAMPSSLQSQLASMLGGEAGVLANLLGQTMPFATNSTKIGETAYGQYGNNHNYDLMRDQANASRRSNMITTALNVAGTPFGLPGIGSAMRGGNGGGRYGGNVKDFTPGTNPWDTFMIPQWLN